MSLLAQLIAKEEGYGIPGSVPTRDNNPGDLRHSPHSFHTAAAPDAIGEIDNPEDGWSDLELQLQRYAKRGYTLTEMLYGRVDPATGELEYAFAPPSENNTVAYLEFLCTGLGVPASTLVSDALKIPGDHQDE